MRKRARGFAVAVAAVVVWGCGDGATGPGEEPEPTNFPGTWSEAAPLPVALGDAGVAEADGRLYVVAGTRSDSALSAGVYAFDPATGQWTGLEDLPEGLWRPAAVARDGALYAIGGSADGVGLAPRAAVRTRSLDGGDWVPHSTLPAPVSAPRAVTLDGGILVLGDTPEQVAWLPDGGDAWVMRPELAPPFSPTRLVTDGDVVWAVAQSGGSGDGVAILRDGAWSEIGLANEGFVVGAWELDGRLHVLQRLATRASMRRLESDGTWTVLAPPTEAIQRSAAMSIAAGGRLYLIGGREASPAGARMFRVDVFTPAG